MSIGNSNPYSEDVQSIAVERVANMGGNNSPLLKNSVMDFCHSIYNNCNGQ